MLFQFLNYLQPTNYFSLPNKFGKSIFPLPEHLPDHVIIELSEDKTYLSNISTLYDLSWQAIQMGYIGNAETYSEFKKLPLEDEYRFVKKYFNPIWTIYVLLLRILSFNNPIKEINAFVKVSSVKRVDLYSNPLEYSNYKSFNSQLIRKNPRISIVIPTLNRYEYLKDVLHDLEDQDYKNFEVIIIDQSFPFMESFYNEYNLDLKLVYQEERALWSARNKAIMLSNSEYILLFDDDSRVQKDWITEHIKCLDYFKADVSSGVSISAVGAEVPKNYSFFTASSQLDTGNVLITKKVFESIGLFDRQFEKQRMGDGEFGLRIYLEGFSNISNPNAKRLHLKVPTGGLREMGSWDAFRPKKWFSPRPIPSVLYLFRRYYGNNKARLALIKSVPSSIMPYRFKRKKSLMVIGAIISVLIAPVILIQVLRSWKLASVKLKQGPLIDKLN